MLTRDVFRVTAKKVTHQQKQGGHFAPKDSSRVLWSRVGSLRARLGKDMASGMKARRLNEGAVLLWAKAPELPQGNTGDIGRGQ